MCSSTVAVERCVAVAARNGAVAERNTAAQSWTLLSLGGTSRSQRWMRLSPRGILPWLKPVDVHAQSETTHCVFLDVTSANAKDFVVTDKDSLATRSTSSAHALAAMTPVSVEGRGRARWWRSAARQCARYRM